MRRVRQRPVGGADLARSTIPPTASALVDLDRLERVLIQAARERRALTYGQLLAFFERRVTRITVGALCRDLGRVERRRQGDGWPDLACLVVRKQRRAARARAISPASRKDEGIECASGGRKREH